MKEVDETLFPKFLFDIVVLEAKHEALMGSYMNLLKDKYPDEFQNRLDSYERLYKKYALKALYEIPQVDIAILEKLKLELGL